MLLFIWLLSIPKLSYERIQMNVSKSPPQCFASCDSYNGYEIGDVQWDAYSRRAGHQRSLNVSFNMLSTDHELVHMIFVNVITITQTNRIIVEHSYFTMVFFFSCSKCVCPPNDLQHCATPPHSLSTDSVLSTRHPTDSLQRPENDLFVHWTASLPILVQQICYSRKPIRCAPLRNTRNGLRLI